MHSVLSLLMRADTIYATAAQKEGSLLGKTGKKGKGAKILPFSFLGKQEVTIYTIASIECRQLIFYPRVLYRWRNVQYKRGTQSSFKEERLKLLFSA